MKYLTTFLIIIIVLVLIIPISYCEVIKVDKPKIISFNKVFDFIINVILTILIWRTIMTIINLALKKRRNK